MDEARFDEGAVLFRQGDAVDALLIVSKGTVGLLRRRADGSEIDRRMSPGNCLGIVGLITGDPFAATATALMPVRALRLDRAGLARAIGTRPELVVGLEHLARRGGVVMLERDAAADDERPPERADMFLGRVRSFMTSATGGTARRGA